MFFFYIVDIQWSAWLEPFQYQLWLSIVGFINFILIIIWWIDRKSPQGHYRQRNSGDDGFTMLGIVVVRYLFFSTVARNPIPPSPLLTAAQTDSSSFV